MCDDVVQKLYGLVGYATALHVKDSVFTTPSPHTVKKTVKK